MYLHVACFGTLHHTFIKVIRNNKFTTWPGLTSKLLTKHLSTIITTTKRQIHQERQNLQSTKSPLPKIQIKDKGNNDDLFPLLDAPNAKYHDAAYTITEFTPKYRFYMYLTGNFSIQLQSWVSTHLG